MATCSIVLSIVICASAAAEGPLHFEKAVLDTVFRAEGVAVADVNRDGRLDILAGEFWYEAPDWARHELAEPGDYDGAYGYARAFFHWARDMNGDGWDDFVGGTMVDEPYWWLENPKNGPGHWREHVSDRTNWGEAPALVDLCANGTCAMVSQVNGTGHIIWAEVPADGEGHWATHVISGPDEPGQKKYRHGMGVADLNGDGRLDVVSNGGWWAAPEDRTQTPWPFHEFEPFGDSCANIEIRDMDADGDPDLVTSSGHQYGVWWYENTPAADGTPSFARHTIDDTISQTHAMQVADLDGDGDFDLITGKRWWAHGVLGSDPGTSDPALLVWYENKKDADGRLSFVRHEIDDDSGVGCQFLVRDVDGNGALDIVISSKKGVFVFRR